MEAESDFCRGATRISRWKTRTTKWMAEERTLEYQEDHLLLGQDFIDGQTNNSKFESVIFSTGKCVNIVKPEIYNIIYKLKTHVNNPAIMLSF